MKVLVLGAAVSGRAAAGLATRRGDEVTVYDRSPDVVAGLDLDVATASGDWDDALLAGTDLVVTSPGIPERAAPIVDAAAAGVRLVSELEFAAAHLSAPYVAVTGTNGKTTVTETAASMMQAGGMRAVAAGNVGLALSDVALDDWDCVAIEASSFQLRFIDGFHPVAAAILNIAPDHLDWHGSFAAYAAAKARIHENQGPDDVIAYGADDAAAVAASAPAVSRHVPVAGDRRPEGGNGPDGSALHIGVLTFPRPALDAVWQFDVAVAATLAHAVDAPARGIGEVVASFQPGRHRRTVVAERNGVRWVNDSKATNPHAAVASASAYPSVILIAGGRNKDLDLAPLVHAATVRRVLAIGEAGADLHAADPAKVTVEPDLGAAVATAAQLAVAGDTVLLAPGCASFDMFDSYAHRGEVFTKLVHELAGVGHGE